MPTKFMSLRRAMPKATELLVELPPEVAASSWATALQGATLKSASLALELPLETRRATVKAMLSTFGKSMGATPATVVADASRKLAALHAFGEFVGAKTLAPLFENKAAIAELEAQIEAKRVAMGAAQAEMSQVMRGCEVEADRLDDVLKFFSLDVGVSRHAPPILAHSANQPLTTQ